MNKNLKKLFFVLILGFSFAINTFFGNYVKAQTNVSNFE